jgi:DNA-binding XRE family transcriptional regulator
MVGQWPLRRPALGKDHYGSEARPMNDDEFILRELATIRKEKKISQEALAKSLDVSLSTIEKWERCVNGPGYYQLMKWAKRLNYHFDLHPNQGDSQ